MGWTPEYARGKGVRPHYYNKKLIHDSEKRRDCEVVNNLQKERKLWRKKNTSNGITKLAMDLVI